MRDSFIFYRSFYEAIGDLKSEQQLSIYQAIAEYSLNFNELKLTGVESTIFKLILPQLKANNKRYENGTKAKHKQNKSKTEAKRKQDGSKTEANKNVNVNVNVNEKKKTKAKKVSVFPFKQSLIDLGVDEQVASDWMKVRKKLNASDTQTAFAGVKNQIAKCGLPPNECITIAVERSWKGFNAEWVGNINPSNQLTTDEELIMFAENRR